MEPAGYIRISAPDALRLMDIESKAALFDVRDVQSYQTSHLDGAAQLTTERFLGWATRLDKNEPVVIYCYHGNASQTYARMFIDFRFTRVYSVDGGYGALTQAMTAAA